MNFFKGSLGFSSLLVLVSLLSASSSYGMDNNEVESLTKKVTKNISERLTIALDNNPQDMGPVFDIISQTRGQTRIFLHNDCLDGVIPYNISRKFAQNIINALQVDPVDMNGVLNTISLQDENGQRTFLPLQVLGKVFFQIDELRSSRQCLVTLSKWANQDFGESSHKAVLDGLIEMARNDKDRSPLTITVKNSTLLGSFYKSIYTGEREDLFFQLEYLKDKPFSFNRLHLNYGEEGQDSVSELQELFKNSSLTSFQLEGCTFDTLCELKALFPLTCTAEKPIWKALQTLVFDNSELGVAGAVHLARFLSLPKTQVEKICFNGTLVDNEAVVSFLENLSSTTLKELDLNGPFMSSRINHLIAGKIASLIPASVSALSLENNVCFGDKGALTLAEKLPTTVKKVNLTRTGINQKTQQTLWSKYPDIIWTFN